MKVHSGQSCVQWSVNKTPVVLLERGNKQEINKTPVMSLKTGQQEIKQIQNQRRKLFKFIILFVQFLFLFSFYRRDKPVGCCSEDVLPWRQTGVYLCYNNRSVFNSKKRCYKNIYNKQKHSVSRTNKQICLNIFSLTFGFI